ncbi:hypothetical protein CDAR_575961 [Caerostris darwini]|uniref:Uncharacterized protein n=1 Tax=Caerostris darwini TaxID=1538125 RepID=A0AAV4X6E0_9ARAC|nr:hypothetical protein CDAR_575961 [Caerostris darwini]
MPHKIILNSIFSNKTQNCNCLHVKSTIWVNYWSQLVKSTIWNEHLQQDASTFDLTRSVLPFRKITRVRGLTTRAHDWVDGIQIKWGVLNSLEDP